jgi:hypothetical protein
VDVTCGTSVDAMPERWLVWHGHGPYGPTRYACAEQRGDLVGYRREHYARWNKRITTGKEVPETG